MGTTWSLKSRQLARTAAALAELVDFFYPVGSYYVQYPAASVNITNDETLEQVFPLAKRPVSMFGGAWEEQYESTPTFFCTRGGFHASEDENSGRTNGLQAGQIFGHYHRFLTENAGGGYMGTYGAVSAHNSYRDDSVTHAISDGTHTALATGYANRPQNRLIKIWKRTS